MAFRHCFEASSDLPLSPPRWGTLQEALKGKMFSNSCGPADLSNTTLALSTMGPEKMKCQGISISYLAKQSVSFWQKAFFLSAQAPLGGGVPAGFKACKQVLTLLWA
uniref:Uncharacterized protein n=1 Tax=Romanomermis culicivorax TaxID=13658 RepID=A0A915HQW2_ROMCU